MDGCWDPGEEEISQVRRSDQLCRRRAGGAKCKWRADSKFLKLKILMHDYQKHKLQGVKVPRIVGERKVIITGVCLTVNVFLRQMWLGSITTTQ